MEITFKSILNYVDGNVKFYLDKYIGSPEHIKEQVAWRLNICKEDCVKNKECQYCGCPPIKKAFNTGSCNQGDRFPDLMNEEDWEGYKKTHNLNIEDAQQGI